jgi:hypothetical protein
MTENNQNLSMPDNVKPPIPSGINILTILTFIGCGIGFFSSCYNFMNSKKQIDQMEDLISSGKVDALPGFLKKFYTPEMVEMARKGYENRLPIFIITVISLVLCFIGALQMRKFKKQGFSLYLIGELLPLVATVVFIGVGAITGFLGIISIGIALLFILLYAGQRKYLVN